MPDPKSTKIECTVTVETAMEHAASGAPYKQVTVTVDIDGCTAAESVSESSFGYGFQKAYQAACEAFTARALAAAAETH